MPKNHLSPHDRFIRSLMSHPETLKEFFDQHLPDEIKKILDFSSIELQKESFIDDTLRLQIADLLYTVKFDKEPGYLYILLEHASTPHRLLPFRMLKYMIKIMDHHLKKTGHKNLPLIYPCILYTGEKPYSHSMDLFDLFGKAKDLAQKTLYSPYQLIDLTQVPDEVLERYKWFGTMSLLSKHIYDKDLLPFLKTLVQILRKFEFEGEEWYIYTMISYVVEAGEVSDKKEFLETIKDLEVSEEKVMSLLEQFKPDIYKRGMEKGLEKGKIETIQAVTLALKLFREGQNFLQVSKATHLSVKELKELKKQIH